MTTRLKFDRSLLKMLVDGNSVAFHITTMEVRKVMDLLICPRTNILNRIAYEIFHRNYALAYEFASTY